jgi:hypothetical protein
MDSALVGFMGVIAIMVIIFLLCRAIVLWYWRVNEGIALLKSIDEKLGRMMVTSKFLAQAPEPRVLSAAPRRTG